MSVIFDIDRDTGEVSAYSFPDNRLGQFKRHFSVRSLFTSDILLIRECHIVIMSIFKPINVDQCRLLLHNLLLLLKTRTFIATYLFVICFPSSKFNSSKRLVAVSSLINCTRYKKADDSLTDN